MRVTRWEVCGPPGPWAPDGRPPGARGVEWPGVLFRPSPGPGCVGALAAGLQKWRVCAQVGGRGRRTAPGANTPVSMALGSGEGSAWTSQPERAVTSGPRARAAHAARCHLPPRFRPGFGRARARPQVQGRGDGAGLASTAAPPPAACPQRGAGLVSLILFCCVLTDAQFAAGRGTRTPVQVGNSPPPTLRPPRSVPAPSTVSWLVTQTRGARSGTSRTQSRVPRCASSPCCSELACSFRLPRLREPQAVWGPVDTLLALGVRPAQHQEGLCPGLERVDEPEV